MIKNGCPTSDHQRINMDKKEQLKNALKELEKAIADIKKKYGNAIDADFLQKKFEEIISNSTKNK